MLKVKKKGAVSKKKTATKKTVKKKSNLNQQNWKKLKKVCLKFRKTLASLLKLKIYISSKEKDVLSVIIPDTKEGLVSTS